MNWTFLFFLNSALLGVGLAMDAFSVSIVNAIVEPVMTRIRRCAIAGLYAFMQFLMPLTGWLAVKFLENTLKSFQKFIPWIALVLLLFIGIKMIIEGVSLSRKQNEEKEEIEQKKISFIILLTQGIATSIDALSVGFTIAEYNFSMALTASLIIAIITFIICITGLAIGRTIGFKIKNKATIIGGIILVIVGLEIFIKSFF